LGELHSTAVTPTPADFRARIARQRAKRYELGAIIGLNPIRLAAMLNERIAMPLHVAERLTAALDAREQGGVR
jgi:hypothetical protein